MTEEWKVQKPNIKRCEIRRLAFRCRNFNLGIDDDIYQTRVIPKVKSCDPQNYKTQKMSTCIAEKEKPVDYLSHGCTGHLLQCPRLK